MTSDDQHFLDLLSSLPTDILRYSLQVTTTLERNFDQAALTVREHLSSATWLPPSARPTPPPSVAPVVHFPQGHLYTRGGLFWHSYHQTADWISEHRAVTAAIIAFLGTGGWLVYRRRKDYVRKRRVKRAANGTKREVVVVAGNINSQIPRSVVLDLERRGFIVYVVVDNAAEGETVTGEAKPDIMPLHLNVTDPFEVQSAISHFRQLLKPKGHSDASSGLPQETLGFAGLILIPDFTYPTGPIETLPPDLWSDALNIKVLHTVATAQAFMRTVRDFQSRILVLTPSVISSLRPAFHGMESAVVGAIDGLTASMRGELAALGVHVCHFKLGTFDISKTAGSQQHLQRRGEAKVMEWPANAREAYAPNYLSQRVDVNRWPGFGKRGAESVKGSPLRELNNAVFDALTQDSPRAVWRVGKGSLMYEMVGKCVPAGIVGWMMGIARMSGRNKEPGEEREMGDSVRWEKWRG